MVSIVCDRPLWVEYPKDTATFNMDDQFLIGKYETRFLFISFYWKVICLYCQTTEVTYLTCGYSAYNFFSP